MLNENDLTDEESEEENFDYDDDDLTEQER